MGKYLNPDNLEFRGLVEDDIYVDKTGLLKYTNGRIGKARRYVCVARPRRFGKSAAADMLTAYYSRGCDSRALFENLRIAQDPSFEEHLNKYDVLHINVKNFMSAKKTVSDGMELMKERIGEELMEYDHDVKMNDLHFMLADVYEKTKIPFVIIIDEWDCPIREKKKDKTGQKEYSDFICNLVKGETCVALCYMTGILPVAKYGTHSEANMFKEISMTSPKPLEEYFGFTEDEVKGLCAEHGRSFDEMRDWYDGYTVGDLSVYNPNSVVNSLLDGEFKSYWTKTESYEALESYIGDDEFGIHDVIVRLLLGDSCLVDPDLFANDLVRLRCLDDILTLLVHLGYLTYDQGSRRVRIPNFEIRREFIGTIMRMKPSPLTKLITDSQELLEATLNRDEAAVAEGVAKMHDSYHETPRKYNSEDELEAVVRFAYIAAINYYDVEAEPPAGKGYADLVFTPISEGEVPAMVIELEAGRPASGAIAQIKERRYADRLGPYRGEVYLVGISYDVKTKVHECLIDVIER